MPVLDASNLLTAFADHIRARTGNEIHVPEIRWVRVTSGTKQVETAIVKVKARVEWKYIATSTRDARSSEYIVLLALSVA